MRTSPKRQSLPLRSSLAVAVSMALASGGLQAATFAVTATADSGPGSFREAISLANDTAGPDIIDFSPITGSTITLDSDLPLITDHLILQGSDVTVDGAGQHGCLAAQYADLTVEDMTITHCLGSTLDSPSGRGTGPRYGGGILSKYGDLTVTGSTISDNSAGPLEEKYGQMVGNGIGGGITAMAGTLTISDSVISGNSAVFAGGVFHSAKYQSPAAEPDGVLPPELNISASTISNNTSAGPGGGMMLTGMNTRATIDRTEVVDNQAYGAGGGIFLNAATSSLELSNSTISDNSVYAEGGYGGGALIALIGGTLELRNNTISNNSADIGGGLYLNHDSGNIQSISEGQPSGTGSPITLVGQTITGNAATASGGGLTASADSGAPVRIDHSIISGNSAAQGSGDLSSTVPTPRTTRLRDAVNARLPDGFGPLPPLPQGSPVGTTFEVNYSLIGLAPDDDSVFVPDTVTSDLLGQDPELAAALADNGGPTRTLMPSATSPALDIVTAAGGCGSSGFNLDQRGEPRPETGGSLCDAGSVERAAPPLIDINPDISFGEIDVGTVAGPETVTLANQGGSDLEVSAFDGLSAPFTLDFSDCGTALPFILPAGESCALQVGFAPTAAGDFAQTVTVTSDSVGGDNHFDLSGRGLVPGISATALDFGGVPVGQDASDTVTIENTGLGSLDISDLTLTDDAGGAFTLGSDSCSAPIPATGSCTVTIDFTPGAPGAFNGSLAVTSNATAEPLNVALGGTGLIGDLLVTPLALDFGDVELGDSSQADLTLGNNGDAPLIINGWSDPGAPFSLTGGSCPTPPFTLNPGESCSLGVAFSPTGAGDHDEPLTFSISGTAESSVVVNLSGGGTVPAPVRDAVSVPTLNSIGLVIGGGLLALMGLLGLRRRHNQS